VPDSLVVLLDQNIPHVVAIWLRERRPQWVIHHTSEVGLSGKPDEAVFAWAQERQALIITFDEDFADARSFLRSEHFGIVRLKVWPTTVEETQDALARLFSEVQDQELTGALVIIERSRIRVRPRKPSAR